MVPTFIPEGFSLQSRQQVFDGVVEVYRDASGERELSFLSGVGGEVGERGIDTGRRIRIRGFEAAELVIPETKTRTVVWMERDPSEPCHQYSVNGVGLTDAEWDAVLAGIR